MDELMLSGDDNEALKKSLIESEDVGEINQIIARFNTNIRKKETIRTSLFSELQDKVALQVKQRLEEHADEFSNKDLLGYMTALQQIIDKQMAQTVDRDMSVPQIAIQQNNIQVGAVEAKELSKDSRDRIKEAIDAVLNAQQSTYNPEVIDARMAEIIESIDEEKGEEIDS